MDFYFNGNKVNLEPYYFTNNLVMTAVDLSQGPYYYSYDNAGKVYNLTEFYEDIFNEHKNDVANWSSGAHVCGTYTKEFNGEEHESVITETITHQVHDDFLEVNFFFVLDNQGITFKLYYPRYSPYQNLIVAFFIAGKNQSQTGLFGLADPIYVDMVQTTGGFMYSKWNSDLEVIEHLPHDWSDLARFPTPDPAIPLTLGQSNYIRRFAGILSYGSLSVNGYYIAPLTPDDDINTPHTTPAKYSDISEPVDFSTVPVIGPLDTGFIKAYVLTIQQARLLAEFMLTDDFLTNVKKLFLQPIDYIISLHFLPVHPSTTTTTTVKIGGVDSEVQAPQTFDSYVTFKSGKINLDEFWGSFLDYAPSTKILCHIPFVGIRELNTDDVMTGELELQYNINTLDGDFVVELKSDSTHKLNGVIATFQGNMLMSTPVTATDYTNKIMAGFTALSQGMTALAGASEGGASADVGGMMNNIVQATIAKPDFARSGNVTGGAGMLGNFTPYLIKVRPKQAVPKLYTKLFGKPSMIGGNISMFNGYTEIKRIDLSGIPCTDNERKEIEEILKGGAFL